MLMYYIKNLTILETHLHEILINPSPNKSQKIIVNLDQCPPSKFTAIYVTVT